ncbi:MAG: leucine-rich repeat protein [Clostridia bacterium]|nr:leucine-rich repeat protein [Clostridia bacterium]
MKWDSPRKLIGKDQYNITQVLLECVNETDQSTRIIRLPADSTQTTVRQLTPGAAYAFRLYAESDHMSTKTGIVTGLKSFALRIRTLMKSDASLPASITSIADEAFMNTSFSAAAIPDGTERIGKKAFSGNTHLRQVCIPASVTEISDDAFDGCSDDLILYGVPGSYAESWATLNGYTFCPHE